MWGGVEIFRNQKEHKVPEMGNCLACSGNKRNCMCQEHRKQRKNKRRTPECNEWRTGRTGPCRPHYRHLIFPLSARETTEGLSAEEWWGQVSSKTYHSGFSVENRENMNGAVIGRLVLKVWEQTKRRRRRWVPRGNGDKSVGKIWTYRRGMEQVLA